MKQISRGRSNLRWVGALPPVADARSDAGYPAVLMIWMEDSRTWKQSYLNV